MVDPLTSRALTPEAATQADRGAIFVTRTFLPPREEYLHWLDQVYASNQITNNGPIHQQLEERLRERFQVPHMRLMANGTLAIQIALRALGVTGKVITTPFSYVATTSAILWEGCTPVFVDIDPATCCIDPNAIEAAITPDTSAILATHVYGIPCDVEAIADIARKHGLKVIYDAAHAFDVEHRGRSILQWGDASTLSFHATKLFHTVEGGATVFHDGEAFRLSRLLRSFGHIGDEHFTLGINAKMSEVHAAMGMAVLPHVPAAMEKRKHVIQRYDAKLIGAVGRPVVPTGVRYNHAYYPIHLADGGQRQQITDALLAQGVHPRRYFYPSLNLLPYVARTSAPISERMAECTLCLPLYPELTDAEVDRIAGLVLAAL